jgi:hypothetical protein
LSLTPNIDDPAMTELMVSSIFDSGYYASIRVVDLSNNKVLVERAAEPDASGVPVWFVKMIGLAPAGGDAIVSRGWQQAARVEVISHPMFALAKLWQSALGSLGWLLLCGAVSAVLGALLLRRQLKPLDYMVAVPRHRPSRVHQPAGIPAHPGTAARGAGHEPDGREAQGVVH